MKTNVSVSGMTCTDGTC